MREAIAHDARKPSDTEQSSSSSPDLTATPEEKGQFPGVSPKGEGNGKMKADESAPAPVTEDTSPPSASSLDVREAEEASEGTEVGELDKRASNLHPGDKNVGDKRNSSFGTKERVARTDGQLTDKNTLKQKEKKKKKKEMAEDEEREKQIQGHYHAVIEELQIEGKQYRLLESCRTGESFAFKTREQSDRLFSSRAD